MNPFKFESKDIETYYMNWKQMYPKSYDKNKVSPFTKVRIILMNGTEFEFNWFLHQFARNCNNQDLKREIARVRLQEQQQQKRISCLKPINENMLEETIAYEQLAIELTAILAQNCKDKNTKAALDFALLEDFDHLYRFSNLLKMDFGVDAKTMVGEYTEIIPARPTIAHHRHPIDNVRNHMISEKADLYTKLVGNIITAAEQQTMNFYMNMAQMYKNDLGRRLFAEIGMVEEEHVTQYESLKDPTCTWLEQWVMHEYTECYLYYSMYEDESDEYIKDIWKEHFEMEVSHLKLACECLKKYEGKDCKQVIPKPDFPKLLKFGENIAYVRKVILTANVTSVLEEYIDINKLRDDARFFKYNNSINRYEKDVASHATIEKFIKKNGKDYRYQVDDHPIKALQNRSYDSVEVGRIKK
ncbi:MAG: hypothetical protein E7376_04670 [Clostridiales bacterium]|nr:hypothetical protein [Clostridiales bacterium]